MANLPLVLTKLPARLLISGLALWLLLPLPLLAEESEPMPLATQSLLLDGQVLGGRVVVVGERGHILVSEDDGRSWMQQRVPTRSTLTSVVFVDDNRGWAAGHDAVILGTSDGGFTWELLYSDPDDERPILDLWFHDELRGYAVGAYGLFLGTTDGGRSWTNIPFVPAILAGDDTAPWGEEEPEAFEEVDFHLNQISATPTGRLYIAAETGHLYRSDDGARSWVGLPTPYEGSFYGSLPLGRSDLILYGLRGHLFHSSDAGITWRELAADSFGTLNDGVVLRDGRIVVAGLAGSLLVSGDRGQSFRSLPRPDRLGIARILEMSDGTLLLVGEQGVRRVVLAVEEEGGVR